MARSYGTPMWLKAIFITLASIMALAIAAAPVGFFYWLYHLAAPTSEFGRIFVVVALTMIGLPLTVAVWFVAGAVFFAAVAGALE